jgi:hypothetical protein
MTPIKHPSNNITCAPPASWDDRGGKLRLPVLHGTQGKLEDVTVIVTFWEPSADELAMLLAGGKVQLTCIGGHPACNVSAIAPNQFQETRLILPN